MPMKTPKLLIAGFLLAAAIVSCNKDAGNSDQYVVINGVTSAVPIDNDGGNVTCEEAAAATGCITSFPYTSGKIDYYGGTGPWTVGPITWSTDGTYITWSSTVPVNIAIIVKGGPNANVYFSGCNSCISSGRDKWEKISAPLNPKTGKPYGLSNITFCYSECGSVVAVKSWILGGGFIMSTGNLPFTVNDWCLPLGYNMYVSGVTFNMLNTSGEKVGTGTVNSDMSVTIKLDNPNLKLDRSYVFVGKLSDLVGTGICPNYTLWKSEFEDGNTQTVKF